jgi:hypothetical protein
MGVNSKLNGIGWLKFVQGMQKEGRKEGKNNFFMVQED